jgi:glutathione S-transferase
VTSELHKGFGVLFNSKMPEEGKAVAREVLLARIGVVDKHLGSNAYLLGKDYTLADAYLFNVISWSKPLKLDLSGFRNVSDHQSRVAARPAVKAAMKAEGLIK